MGIFQQYNFTSHSGLSLDWKIECNELDNEDYRTLAHLVAKKYKFYEAIGIPHGGEPFAMALNEYIREESDNLLIVDDILTTGKSMEEMRSHAFVRASWITEVSNIQGIVIFSRIKDVPKWIQPIFTFNTELEN